MIDVEMLLILIVFWIYFILELKRVFVKCFFEFCLRGWWWLREKSCVCNVLMVIYVSFKFKIK